MNGRTISRLAAEAGVNVETIRFYQKKGLVRLPAAPKSGWRQYSVGDVWAVRYIRQARELGFSLTEVKHLVKRLGEGKAFCNAFREALDQKIRQVNEEILRLTGLKESLDLALHQCEARTEAGDCPIANNCGNSGNSKH
ncbi:MAG TPA: MerR family transcriptional regulator [Blastocatellia bacterium]|nr:MerR family transcriptional regulator [Blastocatellia bacterium]